MTRIPDTLRRGPSTSSVLLALPLCLAACAAPPSIDGIGPTAGDAATPTSSGAGAGDESLADTAARAYRRGDLVRAEGLFRELLRRDPDDPRVVYNLAMLNLQRAYAGLERYLDLETRDAPRRQASRWLQQLDALSRR